MTSPDATSTPAATLMVLSERLTRLETKLDLVITRLVDGHGDHEIRIRRLERVVWVASGGAAALGGGVGALLMSLLNNGP